MNGRCGMDDGQYEKRTVDSPMEKDKTREP